MVLGMYPVRKQPDLADVVALARALERDEQWPAGEIRDWERDLARELSAAEHPVAVALAWLDANRAADETVQAAHRRAQTAIHLTGWFVAAAGVVLGWGATLGAFYFDGSGRVNAVLVFALLVLLPAVMLLPFIIAALPTAVVSRIPGGGIFATLASAFSAARVARLAWRVFPRELREAIELVSGRMEKHGRLYATLQKWALLRWSQLFAVVFQATALVASLLLVVFTDLAFGWSTTLTSGDATRDAERVHRMTSALAAPWTWTLPEAQPSLALVHESRYYRVASESVSRERAARLGEWWKFLVLAIAVYGLLPRLVTFGIAHARVRAAARATVAIAPGVSGILRRLHRVRVETAAIEPERNEPSAALHADRLAPAADGAIRAVIKWAAVPVDADALVAAFPAAQAFEAGGAALDADIALARQLKALVDAGRSDGVAIVVKGWEPPLMEFIDFVKMLRDALNSKTTTIIVIPTGLDGVARLGGATAAQLKVWRDKLDRMGDPWLRVVANAAEVNA